MLTPSRRYATLDAWRGIAALAVVVFHCTNTYATRASCIGTVALAGWMGVFVFFPISGYCVFAAVSRQENATIAHFLKRRWRRIFPPYWISVVVTIGLGAAAWPFNRAATPVASLDGGTWLSIATLTQVFLGKGEVVNPVYWSLCYEEQFYVIVSLLLLVRFRHRCWIVLAITALAAISGLEFWPDRVRLTGLFLPFWLPFSGGIAAYLWLEHERERGFAVALLAMLVGSSIALRNPALVTSAAASLLFLLLAPLDSRIAATAVGRTLISLGVFSYSLYLVHVPVGGRIVNLLSRSTIPRPVASAVAVTMSVLFAWFFYQLIERRFLNTRTVATSDYARVAVSVA